jgi:hypothetical protein
MKKFEAAIYEEHTKLCQHFKAFKKLVQKCKYLKQVGNSKNMWLVAELDMLYPI